MIIIPQAHTCPCCKHAGAVYIQGCMRISSSVESSQINSTKETSAYADDDATGMPSTRAPDNHGPHYATVGMSHARNFQCCQIRVVTYEHHNVRACSNRVILHMNGHALNH